MLIPLPTLPEQQKIAAFLTVIDTRIQQLTRKKALLEQYKKGVMQGIFGREIRFKDEEGKEFDEWEEKRFGEMSEIVMGQSPESNSYNNIEEGLPLIQGNADILDRKTNPRNWTTTPTKRCKIGDIILSVRAPVGTVAISHHEACIGRGVSAIRNKKSSHIRFLYQWLLWFEPKWVRLGQGSTFTAINGTDIKSLKILSPSLAEQQKIADFLTALDAKINHVGEQITRTQTYKKGLLQQMFV